MTIRIDNKIIRNPNGRIPVAPQIRFWRMVDKNGPLPAHNPDLGPCWLWTGYRNPKGYGKFNAGKDKSTWAARFAYEHLIGPIPQGLEPDHLCRNRACIRPAHLEVVTHQENVIRKRR